MPLNCRTPPSPRCTRRRRARDRSDPSSDRKCLIPASRLAAGLRRCGSPRRCRGRHELHEAPGALERRPGLIRGLDGDDGVHEPRIDAVPHGERVDQRVELGGNDGPSRGDARPASAASAGTAAAEARPPRPPAPDTAPRLAPPRDERHGRNDLPAGSQGSMWRHCPRTPRLFTDMVRPRREVHDVGRRRRHACREAGHEGQARHQQTHARWSIGQHAPRFFAPGSGPHALVLTSDSATPGSVSLAAPLLLRIDKRVEHAECPARGNRRSSRPAPARARSWHAVRRS